jgi:hypothetical protein
VRRQTYLAGALVAALLAGCGQAGNRDSSSTVTRPVAAAPAATVTIGSPTKARPIAPGFLGLSFEYRAIEPYAGTDPAALDPVFVQLIRNLNPGQAPNLRIGGDTTDWTWWPIPGMEAPGGIRFALDSRWIGVTGALAKALGAKLILGINLEANSAKLASTEANALVNGLGASRIQALEPGNEPELYGALTFYIKNGQKFTGRPRGYSFTDYLGDLSRIASGLPLVPLAGPAIGGPGWKPYLGRYVAAEQRLAVLTLHAYPLLQCFHTPASAVYPSVAHLLSARSTTGLADGVAPYALLAHQHHLLLRIDEMNSLSCGHEHQVSDAFVSALWALDALFEMARVGVDGVNMHSFPSASSELFNFTHGSAGWSGHVNPDYYGLLMFAQAAPAHARLLRVSGASALKIWATRAPDRKIRIVLINEHSTGQQTLALRVPDGKGAASAIRLEAPGMHAHSGITLGGQTFGASTTTGQLAGRKRTARIAPRGGAYDVSVPAASAVLITLASR